MQKTSDQIIRELTDKIKDLERALQKAQENAGYGLKREDKHEIFEERAQNALPVLKEVHDLRIDNADDVDHLIIEGDNYHLLSALNYTHKEKIDVIYIDPPYNTGKKDFTYNDNYLDKEDSYRHSKWLSFMHKRLRLAKELLKDDGVIFISIDDNEFAQLKLLCDDVFEEKNFVSDFIRKTKSTTNDAKTGLNYQHEFLICYAKNKNFINLLGGEKDLSRYSNPDNDPNGEWKSSDPSAKSGTKENNYFAVKNPYTGKEDFPPTGNFWRFSKNTLQKHIDYGTICFKKEHKENERGFIYKRYKKDLKTTALTFDSLSFVDNEFMNQFATKELLNLGMADLFTYPKGTNFLKKIIQHSTNPNSTILDFFAGSGTTGHAVLELNKEDSGKRQFILCSNTENTKENPDKNICRNITYERVKRVMQGYTNAKGEAIEGLGGGNLRYYTTDFIKKEKTSDDLRQKFIYLCDELLCIKEDTFTVLDSDFCSDQLKCYYKKDHYTVILYDLWQMDKLQQLIAGLDGQISLYLFSLSKDAYEEELLPFVHKVTIENVPDEILETYHKIF